MASSSIGSHYYKLQMDKLMKGLDYTPPPTMYFALFTKEPDLDGTGGIEVLPNLGYVRMPIDTATGWAGGTGKDLKYSNAKEIEFGKPTGDWGTIVSVCLFDAPTGGNLIFRGTGQRQTVNSVDRPPVIEVGGYNILQAFC